MGISMVSDMFTTCQVRLGLVHVLAEDVHSEGVLRHKHLDEERRYGVSVVKLHIEREDT